MGYIVELWKTTKTGKNRGKPQFFKKAVFDEGVIPQIGQIVNLVGTNKNEIRYRVANIQHSIYTVPKEQYNSTGTEYYSRIFIERF